MSLRLRVGVTQMVSYLRSREYDRWREGEREGGRKREKGGKGPVNCCNSETKLTVSRARKSGVNSKWTEPSGHGFQETLTAGSFIATGMANLKALPFILSNIFKVTSPLTSLQVLRGTGLQP